MGLVRRGGPLTVSISSVFTGCLVVSYFSSFFVVAAVGFPAAEIRWTHPSWALFVATGL